MPVYTNLNLEYSALGLGQRIRELRKTKGWTLKDLASRLSISVASLSGIENEKAVLDLERLVAISEALGVRPDVLFPRSRTCHFEIMQRTTLESRPAATLKVIDQTSGTSTAYHNLLRPLADAFVGKHIEPFHIEVRPVTKRDLQFICHHHEEFFFVLRGEVECLLKTPEGLVRETLAPGDCMYFWSYLPHCIRSTRVEPAYSIHLLYAVHGATDSEYANGGIGEIYFRDVSHRSLTQQIAGKITALRQARGMSTTEFARHLEIGVRQLTEIERGRKPVSLELLVRVCRKFRKPLEYFLAGTLVDKPFHFVLRAGDIPRLPVRTRRDPLGAGEMVPTEFRPLAGGFANRGMHPYYVKLHDSGKQVAPMHEHHGQEFVYVLTGEITLLTMQDGQRISQTLSAGDSCFIDSTVPHRFVGAGLNPYERSSAEVIDVFWCPLGESYLFETPGK